MMRALVGFTALIAFQCSFGTSAAAPAADDPDRISASLDAAKTDDEVKRILRGSGMLESLDLKYVAIHTPRTGMDVAKLEFNLFGDATPERLLVVRFESRLSVIGVFRRQGARWVKIPGVLWTHGVKASICRAECPGGLCIQPVELRRPGENILALTATRGRCPDSLDTEIELSLWQATEGGFHRLFGGPLEEFRAQPARLVEQKFRFTTGDFPRQLVVTGRRYDVPELPKTERKGFDREAALKRARELSKAGPETETTYSLPFLNESADRKGARP